MEGKVEQTKMENMNLISYSALLQSSKRYSSIQHDSDYLSFSDTQFLRVNHSTPHKLPTAPHPSPVMPEEFTTTSHVSDQFTSDLLKAYASTFCDDTEPREDTTKDMATESPSTSLINNRLLESSPKESACTTFCDNAKPKEDTAKDMATVSPSTSLSNIRLLPVEPNPRESACSTFCGNLKQHEDSAEFMATVSPFSSNPNLKLLESNTKESARSTSCDSSKPREGSAEDMATVSPSTSYKIPRQSQCNPREWDKEYSSPKCVLREMKCSFPGRLGSSMSDLSLNTSGSDTDSTLAHRASDISDLSTSESENLNSYKDTSASPKLEGRGILDEEFPIDGCKINSPRKPVSSVGQFLNWRKIKLNRKINSSVGNICTPETEREQEDGDSKFQLTV